jgi:hypothetical protein
MKLDGPMSRRKRTWPNIGATDVNISKQDIYQKEEELR